MNPWTNTYLYSFEYIFHAESKYGNQNFIFQNFIFQKIFLKTLKISGCRLHLTPRGEG